MDEILGSKILIIDDKPDNVVLLAKILTRQGYEVHQALSGEMALALLKNIETDLILLDVNMPKMNGYELFAILKKEEATREIPVIFISAQDDLHNVVQAFSLGAVDYITKPFRSAEVLARINTHLSLHRLRQKLQQQNVALQQEICQQFGVDQHYYDELSRAIARQEFELFYQPIVRLQGEIKIDGFEALLRWRHPVKGIISPAELIPIAENTGLIHVIGEWVVQRAMTQLSIWHRQFPEITMSINVSGKQLLNLAFATTINDAIKRIGVNPSSIKLEITESAIIVDVDQAIQQLHKLRRLGVKICLDDFGVGYSSLSRIQEFPIDIIKVDQSFVRQENWTIVNIIFILSALLDMEVIAEGIETVEQLKTLRQLTCHYGQGYLFSRPVPVYEAEKLLTVPFQFSLD